MNSRLYRVVAGFLCAFVVISLAPAVPAMVDAVVSSSSWPAAWAMITGVSLPRIDPSPVMSTGLALSKSALAFLMAISLVQGDGVLPLAAAGALTLLLLASMARRHVLLRAARPVTTGRHTWGLTVARASDRIVARARKDDSLGERIREAAAQGERASMLARRFGLSQDAIRAATGRRPTAGALSADKAIRPRPRASVGLPTVRSTLPKRVASRTRT